VKTKFQLVKPGGSAQARINKMDAEGNVRIQIGLVTPGRSQYYRSGNIHRSFSVKDARVSEIYELIMKALGVEMKNETP
jgi:hypothetical protein